MKTKSFTIKFIPHNDQRYETVGDWTVDPDGNHVIYVSEMDEEKYSWLVGFHELAEFMLCLDRGITQEAVDAFDKNFEAERAAGTHTTEEEPGDADDAPYRKEHSFASACERHLSVELGVNWQKYDEMVMSLCKDE